MPNGSGDEVLPVGKAEQARYALDYARMLEIIPVVRLECPACEEMHAPHDTTWQQWQCACCGSWNDRAADGWERLTEEHYVGNVSLSHIDAVSARKPGIGEACGAQKHHGS